MDAVEYWKNNLYPVTRLKLYLINRGWLEEEKAEELNKSIDEDIKVHPLLLHDRVTITLYCSAYL